MARPRTFDADTALEAAMAAFWRLGYEAASVHDLTRATGLSRSSLYQAFGSKRELFDAAVAHYMDRVPGMLAPLAPGGLDAVAAFFDNWQRRWRGGGDDPLLGCLVVNSTAELGGDEAFAPTAAGYREMLLEAFAAALRAAEERGETDPGRAGERARVLVGLTMGIFVAARGNPDDAEVDALFDATRAVVRGWRG